MLRDYSALEQKCSDLEQNQATANQFKMMNPPSPAPSSVDLTAASSVADIRGLTPSSSPVPPEGIVMNGVRSHLDFNSIVLVAEQADAHKLTTNGTGALLEELQRKEEEFQRKWEGEEGRRKEVEGRNAELEEKLAHLRAQWDAERVALETEKGQLTREVESLREVGHQADGFQKLQQEVERLSKENAVSVCPCLCICVCV